jgi:MoaA/NifB/PqqE/SkfB family radical SAM enzyme
MSDEVFLETLARYNAGRSFDAKSFYSACYAPFVSLYLDQFGDVLVCCQNRKHVVGNVTRQSLREIWRGSSIGLLRDSLRGNDLRRGCQFCESQFLLGNADGSFMRRFDDFSVQDSQPAYPKLLEFSLSNTCNLECVMCNGDWSSLIRTRRERRSPLPKVFGDAFFEELREFLPHLEWAYFYGGEPFLASESYRIWEMMIDLELQTPCLVTTNGTQWNHKVERILERLPISLSVSIDGITRETFETIRKNARFDEVMANLDRFQNYANERGTTVSLSHCLVVPNCHEFGDYLLFADSRGIPVTVNLVYSPAEVSLFSLPAAELSRVVESMELRDEELRASLKLNRHVWIDELDRLRHLVRLMAPANDVHRSLPVIQGSVEALGKWAGRLDRQHRNDRLMSPSKAAALLVEWSSNSGIAEIELDRFEVVTHADFSPWGMFEFSGEMFVGRRFQEAGLILQSRFGANVRPIKSEQNAEFVDDMTLFVDKQGGETIVRAISIPRFSSDGAYEGLSVRVGFRRDVGTI